MGAVLLQTIWKKLELLLEKKELHHFRFLLNIQQKHLEGTQFSGIDGLIGGFSTLKEVSSDPGGFVVDRFLHDNLFKSINERDSEGWSPLCFAALKGDAFLVESLLTLRADANDSLTKGSHDLPKSFPVLSVAVGYKNHEVIEVLLAFRAQVNARCGYGATALHWAAVANSPKAVRLLIQARADSRAKMPPSASALRVACGHGSVEALRELLAHDPNCRSISFKLRIN